MDISTCRDLLDRKILVRLWRGNRFIGSWTRPFEIKIIEWVYIHEPLVKIKHYPPEGYLDEWVSPKNLVWLGLLKDSSKSS